MQQTSQLGAGWGQSWLNYITPFTVLSVNLGTWLLGPEVPGVGKRDRQMDLWDSKFKRYERVHNTVEY
jgi:hypothetical protein